MSDSYFYETYDTPLGNVTMIASEEAILTVHLGEGVPQGCIHEENRILFQAIEEFNQYCAGQRETFDVPCSPMGSEEEQKVLSFVKKSIPYARLSTYETIGAKLGMSPEQVEEILSSNSCPILIPCHRVIRANGKLGTYVAESSIKKKLITFERTRNLEVLEEGLE